MERKLLLLLAIILLLSRLQAQPSAQIQTQPTGNIFCATDTIQFINASTGNYVTSHWFFGDNTDTWTTNPIHIYQQAGDYTVVLVVTDSTGASDTATLQITINPNPNLRLINNEQNQQLIARVDDPPNTSFLWYFNGIATGQTDSVVYYYESGTYAVVATNNYQCSDSQSIYISLPSAAGAAADSLTIHVANNILTPNGDGINDMLYIDGLSSYSAPCQVLIYNRNGQLVYRNDNYTNIGGFDGRDSRGRNLPAGTYYYIIRSEGRKTATGFIDLIR